MVTTASAEGEKKALCRVFVANFFFFFFFSLIIGQQA